MLNLILKETKTIVKPKEIYEKIYFKQNFLNYHKFLHEPTKAENF